MSKYNKHIIIVGSARSGTSWLCELFARPHRYRLLYEPEHEFNTELGYLLCDRWITDRDDAGKGHGYLKRVFRNNVDNDWIAQHSNRKWKRHLWPLVPKRFVIKFVRCNLAANYMNEVFDIPVIHILRNPYNVIESQSRVKFPWLYDLSRFQKQEKLVALVQEKYGFDLAQTDHLSPVEKLALRWCLENVVVLNLQEERSDNYKVIKFEELRNDKNIYVSLCQEFNFQVTPNLEKVFQQPSSKVHPRGLKGDKLKITSINQNVVESIDAMLKTFELDIYPIGNQ
ncbi:MAG TPA: hypothetical protein VKY45_05545 [Marinilabiliaceae bacterium]|nr:hypothetical protein [Marinilabiliaceae bacterium]